MPFFRSKKTKKLFIIIFLFYLILIPAILRDNVYASYTLSVTSSNSQSIDIVPALGSTNTNIGVDNITINTNCRSGYNFSISTSVNNNNLYLNGNITNNTANTYFTPSDGATALSNTTNTWGYYYNASSPTTAPTASNIFNAIPTKNSTPAIIKTSLTSPSATDINDSFNIYYGVSVSNSLAPGTYKMIPDTNNNNNDGTVTYYVTLAENCIPYLIHFNPTSISTGSSLSGTGTMNDQEVYKNDTVTLNPMSFTPPSGYEFKEWNTAQDGTGTSYRNEASITNLTTPGGSVTLYAIWRTPPEPLYNEITNLIKTDINGNPLTQTASDLRSTITAPTSSDPSTDTSNSGVFLYDSSVFGTASDASNDYPIYYYRGILDSNLDGTTSTYGSNGDGEYYPNYVKLNDTCWRIFRTTGSGGMKMIYNGLYGATTTGSCANSMWTVSINNGATPFNRTTSNQAGYLVYAGYTYNADYITAISDTTYSDLFGTNTNFSGNSTNSSIKDYLENTWFPNISDYEDNLEPSAGYCADRTAYSTNTASAQQIAENSALSPRTSPLYFGSYIRNMVNNRTPSLTCPRDIVDLYTTNLASNGNKQLNHPVALLTADEASLAGSGKNSAGASVSSPNSYLRSGTAFYLMSPGHKYNYVFVPVIHGNGYMDEVYMYNSSGGAPRPVISLKHSATFTGGSGTATDPWVLDE